VKKISLSLLLCSSLLFSADEFEDDFGEDDVIEVAPTIKSDQKQDKLSLYGSLSLSSSYNYKHDKPMALNLNDYRGLSSLKTSADLNIEYKFDNGFKAKTVLKAYNDFIYDLKQDDYKTTPKGYDKGFDVNEIYLQGSLSSNVDIKIGRQIVVWGKSDNIRITDSLNPLDNTTPGMVDIEDLRLGKAMSKIDYFVNDWAISAILLHENRFSNMPQYGSDYAPSNLMMANAISVDEPSNSIKNSGIALSASKNMQGQDLSLYYSNQYVDNTIYRSNMVGFAYNKVIDSFLLKTELAYFDNYDSRVVDSKIDSLIGVEYNGISDGSISLEVANKDDDIQYALRFTQSYINQTLDFTALYSGFGKECEYGGFIRAWFDYDINDKLSSSFGFINYIGKEQRKFQMIENNDRVFASIKFSF
jgi:hypothetical protein